MDPKDNTNNNADVKPDIDTTSTPDKMPDTAGVSDSPEIPDISNSDKPVGAVDIDSLTDPNTPDIPEVPAATPPEMPAMPEMPDTTAEDKPSSIDDNPNITIDSTKEPKDDPDEHKLLDVKPAPPAPGSIGSVTSGPATDSEPSKIPVATGPMTAVPPVSTPSDDAPASNDTPDFSTPQSTAEELVMEAANTPPVVAEEPEPTITVQEPKQSRRTAMILVIVLAIILLGACIFGIVMLVQGSTKPNKTSNQPTVTTTSKSELACVMDITATQTEVLQTPVKKAQNTKRFSYSDNNLTDINDTTKYVFENAETAQGKVEALKTNYQSFYAGFSLTQDPFSSNFNVNEITVTVTHDATADQINAKNAPVIGLKLNDSGSVDTEQSQVKDMLESTGYICVAAENTTTTK